MFRASYLIKCEFNKQKASTQMTEDLILEPVKTMLEKKQT